jgi:hypothetical protein
MFTKDEFAASLERTYRTSGFQNAGRMFGLVYRSLRMSMLLEPDRGKNLRERRKALLAAWQSLPVNIGKVVNSVSINRYPRIIRAADELKAALVTYCYEVRTEAPELNAAIDQLQRSVLLQVTVIHNLLPEKARDAAS